MKRLALHLTRLYPRWWRARYGRELEALIEDTKLTCRDLFDLMAAAFKTRIKGEMCAMEPSSPQVRIVDMQHREIPHGYELESVVEYTRDGATSQVRHFLREIDLGDSYVTLCHLSRDAEPAQTFVVSGIKGEATGDFRTDRTEMLVLRADGSVQRTPPETVPVWVKLDRLALARKYAGLSIDQLNERFQIENARRAGLEAGPTGLRRPRPR
jgi:hypothetical protein